MVSAGLGPGEQLTTGAVTSPLRLTWTVCTNSGPPGTPSRVKPIRQVRVPWGSRGVDLEGRLEGRGLTAGDGLKRLLGDERQAGVARRVGGDGDLEIGEALEDLVRDMVGRDAGEQAAAGGSGDPGGLAGVVEPVVAHAHGHDLGSGLFQAGSCVGLGVAATGVVAGGVAEPRDDPRGVGAEGDGAAADLPKGVELGLGPVAPVTEGDAVDRRDHGGIVAGEVLDDVERRRRVAEVAVLRHGELSVGLAGPYGGDDAGHVRLHVVDRTAHASGAVDEQHHVGRGRQLRGGDCGGDRDDVARLGVVRDLGRADADDACGGSGGGEGEHCGRAVKVARTRVVRELTTG